MLVSRARQFVSVGLLSLLTGALGCASGGDGRLEDAGVRVDAGPLVDSGPIPGADAGPAVDAGPLPDAGPGGSDGGPLPTDAGPTDGGPIDAGPIDAGTVTVSPACQAQLDATNASFEGVSNGWVVGVLDGFGGDTSWPYQQWFLGPPSGGPGTSPAGNGVIATSPDSNYVQCTRSWTGSPELDLSACAGTTLVAVVESWHDFWTGSYDGSTWYDGGLIETTVGGGAWQTATPAGGYSGTIRINPDRGSFYRCNSPNDFYVHNQPGFVGSSGGWQTLEIPLPSGAAGGTDLQVRFAFSAGVSSSTNDEDTSKLGTRPGWYLDGFRIEAR